MLYPIELEVRASCSREICLYPPVRECQVTTHLLAHTTCDLPPVICRLPRCVALWPLPVDTVRQPLETNGRACGRNLIRSGYQVARSSGEHPVSSAFHLSVPQSRWLVTLCLTLVVFQTSRLLAQDVTLKREAVVLSDPRNLQIPLRTVPARQIEVVAAIDGFVRQVPAKVAAKVAAQTELCRLEDTQTSLLIERAKANLEAAEAEQRIASSKDADTKAAAQARSVAAKADLKLAEYQHDKTQVKAPFAGEILRVYITPGQYVRAGEKLMILADTTSFQIEIPVDRSQVKAGADLEFAIEKNAVKGKVLSVVAAEAQFEPLRTLVHNLATAVVQIENPSGAYFPGQSVFAKTIPQLPYGHVPVTAVQNGAEGTRKVQVIRRGFVRDLPVEVLTQMGTDRLFVAGAFLGEDEIVVNSSQPLKDGQQVRPKAATLKPAAGTPETPGSTTPAATPKTGF